MILIDSSVWIDFFSSSPGLAGNELRRMIEEAEPFALTGVVIAEVLQGLTHDESRVEEFFRSEQVAGFILECMAGFVGIRTRP